MGVMRLFGGLREKHRDYSEKEVIDSNLLH